MASTQPFRETLPCCGFGTWNLLGPNPNRILTPYRDPPLKPKHASSLILHLSRLLAWALTSALEGDHETGVASAVSTSLDRTLTLAKALASWGPNQGLTASRAWGPEALQADSARNLESQHVVSQAGLQLPKWIPEASSTTGGTTCVAFAAKEGS